MWVEINPDQKAKSESYQKQEREEEKTSRKIIRMPGISNLNNRLLDLEL